MIKRNSKLRINSFLLVLWIVCLSLFLLAQLSCTKKEGGFQGKNAQPVIVSKALKKNVPIEIKTTGNVEAISTVAIKAQISGELKSIHFKEGQEVKKDQLLFTIDPQPYGAAFKQTEAKLQKDQVDLENALRKVERYNAVVGNGGVSEQEHDQILANAEGLKALMKSDEASLEMAKLNLDYCYIKSPIDGRTGELKVHAGNIIKNNDTENPMLIINQIKPIYVTFAVPEANLYDINKNFSKGKLEVRAYLPNVEGNPAIGELTLVDNIVDTSTGTVKLKATFPNNESTLWPGQYVNVVLILSLREGAIVVPSQALQTGQKGQYVFVVKDDMTVEYRNVTAGKLINDESVIEEGITEGETVVTDGQLRLADKSMVRILENNKESSEGNTE
ncbi:efflux RND transporter periplasmic adaptor subunit [bacterium]|nr:efflux RND transporter periplasmic adaptor subunit [bacterium]